MICGWQVAFGDWSHPMAFCAERKMDYRPVCAAHWAELVADGDTIDWAPGNVLGAPQWALRLLWEGEDPAVPTEASAEEMALYAPVLGLIGGE
ncbi:MAG: hypothetical protein ACTHON_18325 [Humibacter sp.]